MKSTVQEKLKLMAWSFLRGLEASSFEVSSFDVLLERCKKEKRPRKKRDEKQRMTVMKNAGVVQGATEAVKLAARPPPSGEE